MFDPSSLRYILVNDDSSHSYAIPVNEVGKFYNQLEDEDLLDSGKFDDLWAKYRVDGSFTFIPANPLYNEILTKVFTFLDKFSYAHELISQSDEGIVESAYLMCELANLISNRE